MKNLLITGLFFLTSVVSYGQRKVKKVEVGEEGFHVKIHFQPVVDEIVYKELLIKILPVSADELNTKFLRENSLNGIYEYSHYEQSRNSYFLKKRKKTREKSDLEFLREGVVWLLDNNIINQMEHDELIKQINYHYADEKLFNRNRIIYSNPYYIEDRYLNVFKCEIVNPTSASISLNANLIVENGTTLLKPLSCDYILSELERNNCLNLSKSLTLERYHISQEICVPPKSEVEKTFAVLPIDFNNSVLKVFLEGTDQKFSWNVIKEETTLNEVYTFYEFDIDWYYSDMMGIDELNFNIIKGESSSVYLGDEELYISQNNLEDKFEIVTISLRDDKLYFGRNGALQGSYFIEEEKNKRKSIVLKTDLIQGLKKWIR